MRPALLAMGSVRLATILFRVATAAILFSIATAFFVFASAAEQGPADHAYPRHRVALDSPNDGLT